MLHPDGISMVNSAPAPGAESRPEVPPLAHKVGLPLEEGTSLIDIAGIYEQRQQWTTAMDYFQQARTVFQSIPSPAWEARTWIRIGMMHNRQNQITPAIEAYQQAVAIVQTIAEEVAWEANLQRTLGDLYVKDNQTDCALESYGRSRDLFHQVGEQANEQQVIEQMERTQD